MTSDTTHHPALATRADAKRLAVIDVGTNSVKLLVADVVRAALEPVEECSEQTRLGRGFYEAHRLQSAAIARTAQAVAKYTLHARELGAVSLRVIATSAVRDAVNAGDLLAAIQQAAGLPVEIISGEQEAEWAFLGVTTDEALAGRPLLILDVGGGSTEFVLGVNRHLAFRQSFSLGTVRLLEQLASSDPPTAGDLARCRRTLREFLRTQVEPSLRPALAGLGDPPVFVGTGGTTTILARLEHQLAGYDRARIEATRLSPGCVHSWTERLWHLPLSERRQIPGLPAERADVILPGVAIYEAVMDVFPVGELRVSTRGLRYGALLG